MSNDKLKHIFDHSACLSAKQLKSYVSGSMVHEEAHAVEVHLLSCPLCDAAVEGLKESESTNATKAMDAFPKEFLKEHLGEPNAEEYISAPTTPTSAAIVEEEETPIEKKHKSIRVWRVTSIAAALVIGVAALWLLRGVLKEDGTTTMAEAVNIDKTETKPSSEFKKVLTPANVDSSSEATIDTTTASIVNIDTQQSTMQEEIVAQEEPSTTLVADVEKDNNANKERELAQKAVAEKKIAERSVVAKQSQEQVPTVASGADNGDDEVRARMGNSFNTDNSDAKYYQNAAGKQAEEVANNIPPTPPKNYTADELYNQKKYSAALAKYKKQMNSADRAQRDAARLNISRCHIALGQDASAKAILQSLIDENSSQKRKAKKLLKKID